jgi:hypothetical protein
LNLNSSNAQSNLKTKLPLAEVLTIIESRFSIHFTYLDQTIANKSVLLPLETLSLENTLEYLRSETNLDFIGINNTSVVISKRSNPFSDFITQKLEEVVITNYLTKGISKNSDGKININTEDFGILPGLLEPDILQSIQA